MRRQEEREMEKREKEEEEERCKRMWAKSEEEEVEEEKGIRNEGIEGDNGRGLRSSRSCGGGLNKKGNSKRRSRSKSGGRCLKPSRSLFFARCPTIMPWRKEKYLTDR